ncbi:GNAT family N-acetyltransferase [Rhizobium sp. AAP116]|uniref:GNAT family N-acetyltransferase n=1 Tax=Rhizobium sp. AAP116 TaxID=1523429 RepID=UPI0006B935DD|nr:GNAT family N-acetyltransferase [Rhizobium sp. AAP116]KPF60418.1 hypothetical protein IP85_03005 [Rhizobium sp. AAP116]
MLKLRAAVLSEANDLTELCLRSKAIWGYDNAFLEACRKELTVTNDTILGSLVQVAEVDGRAVGFAQVSLQDGNSAELEALFVDPDTQRLGVGRALFDWAISTCREHSISTVMIESDPGAASFYRRMGAEDIGQVASGSIPGRMIPKLRFNVI